MMRNMSRGIPRLWKEGYKQFTGLEEAIFRNCEAATSLAEVVRTSFGPNGLSKIVINRIEKVYVTTDAATIISELEIQHPAARVLCLASAMQQREIGDGANFVVIFAGELLKNALELLRTGLHPSDLIRGYTLAHKKCQEIIQQLSIYEVQSKDLKDKEKLVRGIQSSISSKQYGLQNFLSNLVATACLNSMPDNPLNFVVDNIRVVKILGDTVKSSTVITGLVIDTTPDTVCKKVEKESKVAVFTCPFDSTQTETKGTVLLKNAKELLNYNKSEENYIHERVKKLYEMGVKVIVVGEKIGETALHFFDKYKIMGIRLSSKWTLRRLCRSIKARPLVTLNDVNQEDLGSVSKIYTKEIGLKEITVLEQVDKKTPLSTIIIRGSTDTVLADVERAIDDGVNMVRAMTRNGKFVPGAGACEIELAKRLLAYSKQVEGLEQYAIEKYAKSLEVVPRTLAENSGFKERDILAKLYKEHNKDNNPDNYNKFGIDIENGEVKDMTQEGVIDLMATRQLGIKLASQAAMTILKVDHIIMKKPSGGPRPRKTGHWDDNDPNW